MAAMPLFQILEIVRAAVRSVSLEDADLDDGESFERLGIDSLGMARILVSIEERIGIEINDVVLEELAEAKQIGDVARILHGHYGGEPQA